MNERSLTFFVRRDTQVTARFAQAGLVLRRHTEEIRRVRLQTSDRKTSLGRVDGPFPESAREMIEEDGGDLEEPSSL
jgi:hypothetical protein